MHQIRGALRCRKDHARIDAAFKAITGIARQIQISRRSTNAGRQKVGTFKQNLPGGFGHARIFATHDASNGDGTLFICDHETMLV